MKIQLGMVLCGFLISGLAMSDELNRDSSVRKLVEGLNKQEQRLIFTTSHENIELQSVSSYGKVFKLNLTGDEGCRLIIDVNKNYSKDTLTLPAGFGISGLGSDGRYHMSDSYFYIALKEAKHSIRTEISDEIKEMRLECFLERGSKVGDVLDNMGHDVGLYSEARLTVAAQEAAARSAQQLSELQKNLERSAQHLQNQADVARRALRQLGGVSPVNSNSAKSE